MGWGPASTITLGEQDGSYALGEKHCVGGIAKFCVGTEGERMSVAMESRVHEQCDKTPGAVVSLEMSKAGRFIMSKNIQYPIGEGMNIQRKNFQIRAST